MTAKYDPRDKIHMVAQNHTNYREDLIINTTFHKAIIQLVRWSLEQNAGDTLEIRITKPLNHLEGLMSPKRSNYLSHH